MEFVWEGTHTVSHSSGIVIKLICASSITQMSSHTPFAPEPVYQLRRLQKEKKVNQILNYAGIHIQDIVC